MESVCAYCGGPCNQRFGWFVMLYVAIESTLTVLKQLFQPPTRGFDDYFLRLTKLGQSGATSINADPATALESLTALKREILTRESGAVKNRYMNQLGRHQGFWQSCFWFLARC